MDATDQSNLLSSIKLMKELKDLIICEARALFSPNHPNGHTFDVIVSKTYDGTSYEYEARLIVYTARPPAATHTEWVVQLANQRLCESPVDAMADLLEGLYERAGEVLDHMVKGAIRRVRSELELA